MILCKNNVHFKRILSQTYSLFPVLEKVWGMFAVDINIVITSANDSSHMARSLHYEDKAIDVRSMNLTDTQKRLILEQLKLQLDQDYDILLENIGTNNEHFHIEFDKHE